MLLKAAMLDIETRSSSRTARKSCGDAGLIRVAMPDEPDMTGGVGAALLGLK